MRKQRALAVSICVIGITMQIDAGSQRQSPAASDIQKRFIGSWRLVSIDGAPNPNRGAHPSGLIYYDASGHMAAQIMPDRPRPTWTGAPTPEQAKDAIAGYTAYFGTYTVDERARTVTHHREGSLVPGPVDFVRRYEFAAGGRLILTPVDSTTHLTWELNK